ncbi:phosphotransferase system, HPr-related protein [Pseudomonas sp. NPDC089401]|uniref:phosphotransferase system, HPr-related protein n=1 Tax=Pseudomonas sp. NPDC089401 TaxID=3364462 RepID=UPI0038286441
MTRPDDPKPYTPTEIDTTEDRMGSVHELDFNDRDDDGPGRAGGDTLSDCPHEDNVTYDDLSPDTLLDETGARDPYEPGGPGPADKALRHVDADEIGAGIGLDEAELARSAPLDGEPWTDEVIDDEGKAP